MTFIAVRDGIMAADSASYANGIWTGSTSKIVRLRDGSLVAAAGRVPKIMEFYAWMRRVVEDPLSHSDPFDAGANNIPPEAVEEETFGALWLRPGALLRIGHTFIIYPDPAKFAAEGCNVEFMLGALAHGASAAEAVSLAIRHCGADGGGAGAVATERLLD